MEFSDSKVKKFLVLPEMEPYISEVWVRKIVKNPLWKKFLYFLEMELYRFNIKKYLIFQETETLKNLLSFRK